jgi:hypothetical protein
MLYSVCYGPRYVGIARDLRNGHPSEASIPRDDTKTSELPDAKLDYQVTTVVACGVGAILQMMYATL